MVHGDHEGSAGFESAHAVGTRSADASDSVSVEGEKEDEFLLLAPRTLPGGRFDVDLLNVGETVSSGGYSRVAPHDSIRRVRERSSAVSMMHERLAVPCPRRIDFFVGKVHRWVAACDMFRRISDLDDFEIVRALENSVTNARRLCHTITRRENERLTAIFVHECHRPPETEDQLKSNVVEVDVVGNGTTSRDVNVRGDHRSTLSIGNEISVEHACSTGVPGSIRSADGEGADEWRQMHRRGSGSEFDVQSLGADDVTAFEKGAIINFDAQIGSSGFTLLQMQTASETHERARPGIVGREDPFHAKADVAGEEVEDDCEVGHGHNHACCTLLPVVGHAVRLLGGSPRDEASSRVGVRDSWAREMSTPLEVVTA